MKDNQEHSPKWWAGHSKEDDGIFISTLSKTQADAINEMEFLFGEDWYENEDLEVILVEIKMVNL